MSGFQNVTGFAIPDSASGFMSLLQKAYFRGVPFSVVGTSVKLGRKLANHQYPFRDGGWVEDMGRQQRTYSFTGYLIGDLAPVIQLALNAALEAPGPGLLIHPTLGAQMVSVVSGATSVNKSAMRVISVAFEFIEAGQSIFPATVIATAIEVVAAAGLCVPGVGASLGGIAGPAAAAGAAPVGEGVAVTTAFASVCIGAGSDPAGLVAMAAGLPTPDATVTNGRYANGSASKLLPAGTTIADLQLQIAVQRTVVAAASATATTSAATFSTANATVMAEALFALIEAVRATMTNPADQVRVLLYLSAFPFTDSAAGSGIGGDMATVRDAMSASCRRLALASLANASSSYLPISYQDAANLRMLITDALDIEITAAADAGDDDVYNVLRTLRIAVVTDLLTRGATLPQVVTVSFGDSLPALVLGQMLYRDASRSDEIAAESLAPHPAFCPPSFQALAA